MGDPLTIVYALVGAAIYAAIGIAEKDPKEEFDPNFLVPTFLSTLIAGVILFLTGQELTSANITTFVAANAGLSMVATKIWNLLKARLIKPAKTTS